MNTWQHLDVSGPDIHTIRIMRTQQGVRVRVICAQSQYTQDYACWDKALQDVIALQSWVRRVCPTGTTKKAEELRQA